MLSPVLAFLLAIAIEVPIIALVHASAPALVLVGAAVGDLLLFRRPRVGPRRVVAGGPSVL